MRARANRRTMLGITAVVCILMAVLLLQSRRLSHSMAADRQKLTALQQQIQDEKKRTQEISEQGTYMQSDEYKEKIAKEKFGLIKDGEIIFKEAE